MQYRQFNSLIRQIVLTTFYATLLMLLTSAVLMVILTGSFAGAGIWFGFLALLLLPAPTLLLVIFNLWVSRKINSQHLWKRRLVKSGLVFTVCFIAALMWSIFMGKDSGYASDVRPEIAFSKEFFEYYALAFILSPLEALFVPLVSEHFEQ